MIDASTFEYAESRWQDIYLALKKRGFDVYPPANKLGECKTPYVVVSVGTSTKHSSFSTDVDQYTVMCYVPKKNYSKLEPFVRSVMDAMKELKPMITAYGSRTPSYYDDSVKAHMVSIEYKNYKQL